jgi:CBS domain-containing protein
MDDSGLALPREPRRQASAPSLAYPVSTVELHAHVAAAAYLMRRAHTTALVVIANDASRRPVATITDADIAEAVADGIDINETYIDELVADGRLRRPSGMSPDPGRGAS